MEQLAIAITGCVAIWLANDQRDTWRKWASVFGLAGQPFWFYSAFAAEQWGILALTFVYTASWARGFHNNWMRSNAEVTGSPVLSASPRGLPGYAPPLPRDGCPASNAIDGKHERDAYGTCGLCGHGKGYPK